MRGVQQTYEEPPESTTSQSPSSAREPETSAEARRDWGDAPDTRDFIGGAAELNTVRTWILMFEVTYWRTIRNAPPASEWLPGAIDVVSGHQLVPPNSETNQVLTLLRLLQERPAVLVSRT